MKMVLKRNQHAVEEVKSAADKQPDDVAGVLQQVDDLIVRRFIKSNPVDGKQLVATLQSAVRCCRTTRKHVLDNDGKVPAIAAEATDDSEAKAVNSAVQHDLSQRLADRATATDVRQSR